MYTTRVYISIICRIIKRLKKMGIFLDVNNIESISENAQHIIIDL